MVECLPAEEEEREDVDMPSDDRRGESKGERQAPMEDGEQRDGSVAEQEVHSKQDLERVKKSVQKTPYQPGTPWSEGNGPRVETRSSFGVGNPTQRMHCDVCAENVQPKLHRPAIPRQVLDFNDSMNVQVWTF